MTINLANPVNWQSPLNRNREAWWLGLGNPYSGVVNWVDLTRRHTLSPVAGLSWLAYKSNWISRYFAASCGTAHANSSALSYDRNFTYTAVVRYAGSTSPQGIMSKGVGGAYLRIYNNKLNFLQSYVTDIISGSTNVPANTWCHVAVTIDSANNGTVYLNGKSDATFTASVTFNGAEAFSLGSDLAGTFERLDGSIAEASVFSRSLSVDEIQSLYRESLQDYPITLKRTQRPIVYYPSAASFKSAWARGSNVILQPGVLT